MRVVTVLGARPQFIKAAAVSRIFATTFGVEEIIIHTGQHFDHDMSDIFFTELDIPRPDINLGVAGLGHGAMTGRMLEGIERALLEYTPDMLLVYGDTNSTLAGALAAAKLHIPVAHVEAGLRSFNRTMPEEINRILADHVSDVLFAPTEKAVRNLSLEGVPSARVHNVGDVMLDVALFYGERVGIEIPHAVASAVESEEYILVTLHRAENTDSEQRMRTIVDAFEQVKKEIPLVFPLHPRARKQFEIFGLMDRILSAVHVIAPVGYLEMVALERNAKLIITDSGGVQKEAFFYSRPCVTLRDETEWTELVGLGWNRLCAPTDSLAIVEAVFSSLGAIGQLGVAPYGDGKASEKIVNILTGLN